MTITKRTLINMGKPSSIIAVDASTNSMAFSYFVNGKLIKYGKIRFVGTEVFYKAGDACKKCTAFFKTIDVDAMVIESAIYSNSPKTAMQLSLVQGAIIAAAQVAGIKIIKSITPMEWQNHISNKLLTKKERNLIVENNPGMSKSWYKSVERNIRKQKTIDYVNNKYDTSIADDDVGDAVAIGSCVQDKINLLFQ